MVKSVIPDGKWMVFDIGVLPDREIDMWVERSDGKRGRVVWFYSYYIGDYKRGLNPPIRWIEYRYL